jgi:hypothetical protein
MKMFMYWLNPTCGKSRCPGGSPLNKTDGWTAIGIKIRALGLTMSEKEHRSLADRFDSGGSVDFRPYLPAKGRGKER